MDKKCSIYSVLGSHGDLVTISPKKFGDFLYRWRLKNNLSASDIAGALGYSNSWYYNIEQGMIDRPLTKNFINFCIYLGFSLSDIVLLLYRFGYIDGFKVKQFESDAFNNLMNLIYFFETNSRRLSNYYSYKIESDFVKKYGYNRFIRIVDDNYNTWWSEEQAYIPVSELFRELMNIRSDVLNGLWFKEIENYSYFDDDIFFDL